MPLVLFCVCKSGASLAHSLEGSSHSLEGHFGMPHLFTDQRGLEKKIPLLTIQDLYKNDSVNFFRPVPFRIRGARAI